MDIIQLEKIQIQNQLKRLKEREQQLKGLYDEGKADAEWLSFQLKSIHQELDLLEDRFAIFREQVAWME